MKLNTKPGSTTELNLLKHFLMLYQYDTISRLLYQQARVNTLIFSAQSRFGYMGNVTGNNLH